jgi:hypothetical protein
MVTSGFEEVEISAYSNPRRALHVAHESGVRPLPPDRPTLASLLRSKLLSPKPPAQSKKGFRT